MPVLGLDLSIASPAACLLSDRWTPGDWTQVTTVCWPSPPDASAHRLLRVRRTAEAVVELVRQSWRRGDPGAKVHAFVEGYSFGSAQRAHHLGELGGVVRDRLLDLSWVELHPDVPSASWRRYLLGKVPSKDAKAVTHAALHSIWHGRPDPTGDELDAFGVANYGWSELGRVGVTLATEAA